MLRRGFATQQRAAPARPAGGSAAKAAAKPATPAAKGSGAKTASAAALAAGKLKGKAGAKRQEVVIEVEKEPHYRLKDVFPTPPLEWCKNASFKDIMRKVRAARRCGRRADGVAVPGGGAETGR